MELNLNAEALLFTSSDGISILDGVDSNRFNKKDFTFLCEAIDRIGDASSKAQMLKQTITTATKFFGTDQRMFIKCEGSKIIGFLKTGKKKLFIRNEIGDIKEISPLCVLDFYVSENYQRNGIGKNLFDCMLKYEGRDAKDFGYDRPSEKLLNFLSKYYGLNRYVPQNNNFVVFDDYFINNIRSFNKQIELKDEIRIKDMSHINPYDCRKDDINYTSKNLSNSNLRLYSHNQVPKLDINKPNPDGHLTNSYISSQHSSTTNPPWATFDYNKTSFMPTSACYGAFVQRK